MDFEFLAIKLLRKTCNCRDQRDRLLDVRQKHRMLSLKFIGRWISLSSRRADKNHRACTTGELTRDSPPHACRNPGSALHSLSFIAEVRCQQGFQFALCRRGAKLPRGRFPSRRLAMRTRRIFVGITNGSNRANLAIYFLFNDNAQKADG